MSSSNARLVAARRLTRRSARREAGRFLVEGAQSVREALAAGAVQDLFATAGAVERYPELTADADEVSDSDAAALSETVTPQGLIAVCAIPVYSWSDLAASNPRLVAVLHQPNDPGNVGTIIRTADAAGADAVVIEGGVDPYNGKVVRASAGSLFHLPVLEATVREVLADTSLRSFATSGSGTQSLYDLEADGSLRQPTAWIFGSEAHGLDADVISAADQAVRVPVHGRAESLNVAAAAAVCLYASARALSV